jgi:hypothetical protein
MMFKVEAGRKMPRHFDSFKAPLATECCSCKVQLFVGVDSGAFFAWARTVAWRKDTFHPWHDQSVIPFAKLHKIPIHGHQLVDTLRMAATAAAFQERTSYE